MRVEIDLFKGDLIAIKYYTDGSKEYFHGDIEVNKMLNDLYASEGKSLYELIANNTIVITKRVWSKFELLGNTSIIRRTADEKVTKTATSTVKEDKTITREEDTSKMTSEKVVPDKPSKPAEKESHDENTKEEKDEEVHTPDGALDPKVVDTTGEKKEEDTKEEIVKPKKGIKNLKRASIAALSLIVGGYILVSGYNHLFKQNEDNKDNNDTDNHRYEESTEYPDVEPTIGPDVFEQTPDNPEDIYRYTDIGSNVKYDDIETQIDVINEACFNFQPCALENLVVDSDREAIYTINNMRNKVLNHTCDADTFLNNIVNYLFENGTIFDGKVIKGYDSLSTYAQYIVLVASQSILQIDTNYEHTTAYNNYNFDVLVNSFDYMVNDAYTRIMSNNKTR